MLNQVLSFNVVPCIIIIDSIYTLFFVFENNISITSKADIIIIGRYNYYLMIGCQKNIENMH